MCGLLDFLTSKPSGQEADIFDDWFYLFFFKQCEVPEEEDSDEEVEEDPVFGVMSVINMSERKVTSPPLIICDIYL